MAKAKFNKTVLTQGKSNPKQTKLQATKATKKAQPKRKQTAKQTSTPYIKKNQTVRAKPNNRPPAKTRKAPLKFNFWDLFKKIFFWIIVGLMVFTIIKFAVEYLLNPLGVLGGIFSIIIGVLLFIWSIITFLFWNFLNILGFMTILTLVLVIFATLKYGNKSQNGFNFKEAWNNTNRLITEVLPSPFWVAWTAFWGFILNLLFVFFYALGWPLFNEKEIHGFKPWKIAILLACGIGLSFFLHWTIGTLLLLLIPIFSVYMGYQVFKTH